MVNAPGRRRLVELTKHLLLRLIPKPSKKNIRKLGTIFIIITKNVSTKKLRLKPIPKKKRKLLILNLIP